MTPITKSIQLELELPVEYQESDNYKNALSEYGTCSKSKYLQPVHLIYNKNNKTFSNIKIFSKEFIINNYPSLIIIKS